jgi:TctA family transporter
MRGLKKSQAYLLSLFSVITVFGFSVFMKAAVDSIYSATLTAIVGLTLAYIGGNVADNGVKGKFYNPNLDRDVADNVVGGNVYKPNRDEK